MSFSPVELRAIGYHAQRHDLVPQLSTYPTIYFKRKSDGTETTEEITHLVDWYQANKKEEARQRANERRKNQAAAKRAQG